MVGKSNEKGEEVLERKETLIVGKPRAGSLFGKIQAGSSFALRRKLNSARPGKQFGERIASSRFIASRPVSKSLYAL